MKFIIYSSFLLLIISCYNQKKQILKDNDSLFLVNPQETRYECDHPNIVREPAFYGFVLYNSEIKDPQEGVLCVTITFDSIYNDKDPIHILSVVPEWIRIKDIKPDSILVNQSFDKITDTTLLRYQTELLTEIKECDFHITYFNKDFIPLKIGYCFRFTVLPDSITSW